MSKKKCNNANVNLAHELRQIAVDLKKGGKKAAEALKKLDAILGIND